MEKQRTMISETYRQQLYQYRGINKDWGQTVKTKVFDIECFATDNACRTMLDFGSGAGILSQKLKEKFNITEYDVGIVGKNILPDDNFDITVCVDVMEHVEPNYINQTLDWIRLHTSKVAFFTICCIPSKGHFANGSNLHKTVCPPEYWLGKLSSRFSHVIYHGNSNAITIKCKC